MGLYVEIHCDYQTDTQLNGGCETKRGDNVQGRNVREVKAEAKRLGWVRLSKGYCCPPCVQFIS